jgi:hypothetical protein
VDRPSDEGQWAVVAAYRSALRRLSVRGLWINNTCRLKGYRYAPSPRVVSKMRRKAHPISAGDKKPRTSDGPIRSPHGIALDHESRPEPSEAASRAFSNQVESPDDSENVKPEG